jgi:hypothetical protein
MSPRIWRGEINKRERRVGEMCLSWNETCKKCNRELVISENEMDITGGKDKEPVKCPCGNILGEYMTNGFWEVDFAK